MYGKILRSEPLEIISYFIKAIILIIYSFYKKYSFYSVDKKITIPSFHLLLILTTNC